MIKRIFFLLALALFSAPAFATISTTASQSTVYGTGSQNVFYFNFVPDSVNDIQVIYTNSSGQQTTLLPSQYLVAVNPTPAGQLWSTSFSVTYPLIGSPISTGTSLTVSRILPLIQGTTLSNQGDFSPTVVEQALDTNEMQVQQVSARTGQIRGTWITGASYNFGDIVVDGTAGNNTSNIYVCAISHTSTTWAAELSAGDWSLALNVQSIISATPNINNNYLYANISGGALAPYGVAASSFLDSAFGSAQGDILYRSGSGWTVLSPGTSGQVLQTNGSSANPSWINLSGGGTITGVTAGSGLTGGGLSGNVTVALGSIANNSMLANTSGSTSAPSSTTLSSFLDSSFNSSQGNIIYRAGTGWTFLSPGTAGQFLETNGTSANPTWGSPTINLSTGATGILPVANGGTGKTSPSLVGGTNVSISGSWPNQTITASTSGFTSCTTVFSAGSSAGATATCGSGYTLTGGACGTLSDLQDRLGSSISGNSYICSCSGGDCSGNPAYAVCCH